jgi:hypothetical protein
MLGFLFELHSSWGSIWRYYAVGVGTSIALGIVAFALKPALVRSNPPVWLLIVITGTGWVVAQYAEYRRTKRIRDKGPTKTPPEIVR